MPRVPPRLGLQSDSRFLFQNGMDGRFQFSVDAQTRNAAVNEMVNFQEKTNSGLTVAWAGILA